LSLTVYFKLNGLGYNCGHDIKTCPEKGKNCVECIQRQLKKMGFEMDTSFEIFRIESYQKDLEIKREVIWNKFLDILNIKHIIIIDKESGLTVINFAVSDVKIDTNLLSGFIQANISFSESGNISNKTNNINIGNQFYEFQYENFNIFLKNGNFIRACLLLDERPSDHLKSQMFQFIYQFEDQFEKILINFQKTGEVNTKDMIDFLMKSFNIELVYPLTIAHSIPPEYLEAINDNPIQKAIFNIINELVLSKSFFYINNLLNRVNKIVSLDAKVVLYEIFNLLENNVIIPIKLETLFSDIESQKNAIDAKKSQIQPISAITIHNDDLRDLKEQIKLIDIITAKKMIKQYVKAGRVAAKDNAFEVALKDFNKAQFIAKEFKLKNDITKISQIIFQYEFKSKNIELEFLLEMAENYEKKGDFINSIDNYQKAIKIYENFLIYDLLDADSQIKKVKKKITKLREEI
jgi:tetratricopeptide (TPR) repeat protein